MNNDETNRTLREILRWQRLQAAEILRKRIKEESMFEDKKHILAYYHTDGEKSTRDIGKESGVSHNTVAGLWQKWIDAGIAEPTEKYGGGRCKRIFELHELGLEVPGEI